MSTAPATTTAEERHPMTPAASNLLGWWWLAIAFTIVLIAAMWPSIFPDSTSSMPTFLAVVLCLALVAVGIAASIGLWRAKPSSAQLMRLTAIIGLGVGLVAVAYFLYAVAFGSPVKAGPGSAPNVGFFGPEGSFMTAILWTFLIALPFIFGLMVIFGVMSDGVDEWFNPPPSEMVTRKHSRLEVDPSTAAILAGGAAVSAELAAQEPVTDEVRRMHTSARQAAVGEDVSVEVIGQAEDDLSVEVIGGATEEATATELAALERALSQDMQEKPKGHGKDDEPLSVDDDLKI